MIRLPSLQKPYTFIYSRDPALKQRPTAPAADADTDAHDKYKDEIKQYEALLTAARDSGRWDDMLIPGESPLKFVLGHVDRTAYRAIADRVVLPPGNSQAIGDAQLAVLLTRLALVDLVGADIKIVREVDPQWGWVMAQQDIIDRLDSYDFRIVNEIGAHVWTKTLDVGPKSSRA